MKRHKIFAGCLMVASMLATTSCSDFLNENPQGKLTPENFFTNQNDLDMSVAALYNQVQGFQCNSNPMIVQCQGDDVTSTTGSNKAAYLSADAFEVPSDAKGVEQLWSRLYSVIKASNMIIDKAGNVSVNDPKEIDIAMGQAYYWRAFSYFSMVRIYGALPVNLHNEPDNNETPLTSVEDVYKLVLSDLEAAEKLNLPAQYTKANRVVDGGNVYVSEQAVKSTIAAVYMAMAGYPLNKTEYYAKAAAKAKEVVDGVNGGKYQNALLANWNDVYNYGMNHHQETILGISYRATTGGWNNFNSQLSSCHHSGKLQGWGDFLAERRFWKNFPEGPRKDAVYAKKIHLNSDQLVDWWATTDGEAYNGDNAAFNDFRPMFIGFTLNKGADGSPVKAAYDYNLPFWAGCCVDKRHQIIRFAEVLCWYAEATARSNGDLASAKAALKQVRSRAYADPAKVTEVDGMSAAALAEAAYMEHGYEVAGNVYSLVTRRADEFRMDRLKDSHSYRTGAQSEVLVPAGTVTQSVDKAGNPFTYTLKADVVIKENMNVTASWNGESSMYQIYPPTEAEKNPNLKR